MKTVTSILLAGIVVLTGACTNKDPGTDTSVKASFVPSGFDKAVPCNVSFINTSKNGSSYLWTFGDGATSNEANPSHVYNNIGTYFLKLKITGSTGATDSVCKVLYFGDATNPTKSSFSYFMDRCTGAPVNFQFHSLNAASLFYSWDFGNGTLALEKSPIIQYNATGTYLLKFSSQINNVRDTVTFGIQIF
jgi:PKD repeat protein